jgi:hypothetical protein
LRQTQANLRESHAAIDLIVACVLVAIGRRVRPLHGPAAQLLAKPSKASELCQDRFLTASLLFYFLFLFASYLIVCLDKLQN